MPHSSNPVDDISVRPFDREHGTPFGWVSRKFGFLAASPVSGMWFDNQRVERLSDGFLRVLYLTAVWFRRNISMGGFGMFQSSLEGL